MVEFDAGLQFSINHFSPRIQKRFVIITLDSKAIQSNEMGLKGFVDLTVLILKIGNIDRRRFGTDFAFVKVVADKSDVDQAIAV